MENNYTNLIPKDVRDNISHYLYQPTLHNLPMKKYQFKVGIIMRTKNRPLFLKRGLLSVINQTYKNWHLVLVNDGGDEEIIKNIITPYELHLKNCLTLINNPVSLGREAAANVGMKTALSEFVVIHDDDDVWHSEFLDETVSFLENPDNADCGAVVTRTIRIDEEVKGHEIIEHNRYELNPNWHTCSRVDIFKLFIMNGCPTMALLIRAGVFDKVGYYNESMPVSGDWEFYHRFILYYEIGFIPKCLTFYHVRVSSQQTGAYQVGLYGNASSSLTYVMDMLMRNQGIRKVIQSTENQNLLGLCQVLATLSLSQLKIPNEIFGWIIKLLGEPLLEELNKIKSQLIEIQDQLVWISEQIDLKIK